MRAAPISILLLTAVLLAACGSPGSVRQHDPTDPPKHLSDWQILIKEDASLRLAPASFAYELKTPLFSDYAYKLRTLWMPEGTRATYKGHQPFEFPVGTIITKTFYFHEIEGNLAATSTHEVDESLRELDTSALRLIETRLLVHSEEGWVAVPYIWNDAQDEASLQITGEVRDLSILTPEGSLQEAKYLIPSRNQCANCHERRNSGGIHPIGPKAWNLDVERWLEAGRLRASKPILHHRMATEVRRYLDVNCAHCHSEEGAGDTSGLFLDITEAEPTRLGLCKPPIAAGQGTGGRLHSIVPGSPEESILVYRMGTTNPAEMMPELGRSLVHEAGVRLVEEWIAGLAGSCG